MIQSVSRGTTTASGDITPGNLVADAEELSLLREIMIQKHQMVAMIEDKDFDRIVELGPGVVSAFENFQKTELYEKHAQLVGFLRRYTITGQYMKMATMYVDALERKKEYEKANEILGQLIETHLSPHRHGKWWLRMVSVITGNLLFPTCSVQVINCGHLSQDEPEALTRVFEQAQQDKNINEPERMDICIECRNTWPSKRPLIRSSGNVFEDFSPNF